MTPRLVSINRRSHEASPQSWLRSFLERRFPLRVHANLKRPARMFFVLVWILFFAPGSLLASWEVPASKRAAAFI